MEEIWKDIEGFEGLYKVSNLGNILSLNYNHTNKERLLTPRPTTNGYLQITLHKNRKQYYPLIHKLVALHFIPNPNNFPQVGHLDDNKENNIVSNLYWTTAKENNTHNGRHLKVAEKNRNGGFKRMTETNKENGLYEKLSRLYGKPVLQIDKNTDEVIAEYHSVLEAARQLGINNSNISKCCLGKYKQAYGYKWKYKE